jgi:PAT family beta-lactamase induction signal transducer AmpG
MKELYKRMKINRYATAFALGLNSGLVYAMLVSALIGYLDSHNISFQVIGLLSLVMIPYSCKPLWSPFIDNIRIGLFPKSFGQRKEWVILPQCILLVCILVLGQIDLEQNLGLFFFVAFIIAFMGATSDIALHGYRIELFEQDFMSKGTAFNVLGFRIGLFIAGSGGLYLATSYSWNIIFMLIGAFLLPGMLIIALSEEEKALVEDNPRKKFRSWLKDSFTKSIASLFKQNKILYILLLLGFYKVSDGYLDTMFLPFVKQMGFSQVDAANARSVGIVTGVLGNLIGVKIIHSLGMRFGLLGAEIFASISNLFFITLIYLEQNTILLFALNGAESFFGGVSNIVLLSYISSMCINKKYTASHFAILTAFSMILRTLLSGTSGWVAIEAGWVQFFTISSLLSVPSILCIYFLFFRKSNS